MATFYLDFINGNDANDGTTFANRWKTFTTGATAARTAPGDTIRCIQSPDPTSLGITATWTNLSRTVTLASALTLNIEMCETAWTASANVTATATTTAKEGTNAASLAIAGAFTTGKVAYKTLAGSTDYSAYQQVSFWFRNNSANSAANVLSIRLCSDTTGDVTVDTIMVPAIIGGTWAPYCVNTGGALGAAIQSVAVYAESDPGAITVLFDDIIACKAAASADSLSLVSLISKNTTNETWYGIKAINGTTVILDKETNSAPTNGRGYFGTTETVTTYKREPLQVTQTASTANTTQESGTSGSPITYTGGWNSTDGTTQVGTTWIDGGCGQGVAFSINQNFIVFTDISVVRWNQGINVSGSSNMVSNITGNNNTSAGFIVGGNANGSTGTISTVLNGTNGITMSSTLSSFLSNIIANGNNEIGISATIQGCTLGTIISASNNAQTGLQFFGSNNTVKSITTIANNVSVGVFFNSGSNNIVRNGGTLSNNQYGIYCQSITSFNRVYNATTSGNSVQGAHVDAAMLLLTNATLSDTTPRGFGNTLVNAQIFSMYEAGSTTAHTIYGTDGNISADTGTVHTGGGISWKLSPTNATNIWSGRPLKIMVGQIACAAASTTIKLWFRRTNTAITGMLVIPGGQVQGVTTDQTATMTVGADTWEELSVNFTPSVSGVVEVWAEAYGGTTHSVYVDDLSVT